MTKSKERVYVLGDERLANQILARLPARIYQVAYFSTGEAFLAHARDAAPGCVIARLLLPDLNCLALLAEMKKSERNFPAIFVATSGESAIAAKALKAGAVKCLTRMPPAAALVRLLRQAVPGVAENSGRSDFAQEAKARISRLTVREREVLDRIAAGLTNKAVARELSLSLRTVEFYRARLMKKLEVSGLAQLVHLAIAAGISLCLLAVTPASHPGQWDSAEITGTDTIY